MKKNIVILGAGYGGLRVALDLEKKLPKKSDFQIVLVDASDSHILKSLLYEVATALTSDSYCEPHHLCAAVAIPLSWFDRSTTGRRIHYMRSRVDYIDQKKQQILFTEGRRLAYDFLVLALGSESETYGIPGMSHAYTLTNLSDALHIRKKIAEIVERKSTHAVAPAHLVVVGAGATGVEFAAELTHLLRRLQKIGKLRRSAEVALIEAGERILPGMPVPVALHVEKRLRELGIKVYTHTALKKVYHDHILVSEQVTPHRELITDYQFICGSLKECEIPADLIVWSGGIRANRLVEKSGFKIQKRGSLLVNSFLQVEGKEQIFALGDLVYLTDKKARVHAPWVAQAAIFQAKIIAENVIRSIHRVSLAAYPFPQFPTVVTLGGKQGVMHMGRMHVSGYVGWIVRQAATLRYLLSIVSVPRACTVWWLGWRAFKKNDA